MCLLVAWIPAAMTFGSAQAAAKLVDDSIKKSSSSQASAGQIAGALGLAHLEAGQNKEALKALQQAEKILKACRSVAESPALQALDEARVCTGEVQSVACRWLYVVYCPHECYQVLKTQAIHMHLTIPVTILS